MYWILCLTAWGTIFAATSSFYCRDIPLLSYAASNGCICDKNRQPVSICLDICQWTN
ncbi:hypothetical protein GGQ79_001014 [Ochrobactrum pecoris]|uniref:Uncharacterized protein n=1 Tax=Brucella pecoris TaxID=867683 RepID=A0AB34YMW8_9HYPH|nr:hypothetical protein [Brucella pecoris]